MGGEDLSPIRRRVLKLSAEGKSPGQIGAKLGITKEKVVSLLQGPTPARQRILDLKAKGRSNRQIAAELDISIQAVHYHLKRHRAIFGKVPDHAAV